VSEPECICPGPGFCERFGIHQGPYAHSLCAGVNCPPGKSEAYRRKWRLRLEGDRTPPAARPAESVVASADVRPGPPPKKAPRRGPCRWEGEVLERCTSCGGEARSVRECLHDDDAADRCTRGPNNGAVRSCLTCPFFEPAA